MPSSPTSRPGSRGSARTSRPRRPRYGPWMATGVVIGLLLAVVAVLGAPENQTFSRTQALLYLVLVLGMLGAVAGGSLAVLLDRRADRDEQRQAGRPAGGRPPTA